MVAAGGAPAARLGRGEAELKAKMNAVEDNGA
jgi:hypothetical protein